MFDAKTFGALIIMSLAACGGGGGGGGSKHWSERPLETVEGTVDGVAFTIEVPKGMRMTAKPDEVSFDFHENGRVFTPSLYIRKASSHDSAAKDMEFEKDAVALRKEDLADGWVTSFENTSYKGKEDYVVHAQKWDGDRTLSCNGRVSPWKKGEQVKAKVANVEAMCLSLRLK